MIQHFDLDSKKLRIREILTDKSFLEIEIYAISNAKPNRNGSYFTIESMKSGLKTFNDKPILGFFNSQNDFESHNGRVAQDPELGIEYWDNSGGEQILGFVRQSDHKEIVEGDDGLLWIRCTAMICTQYNYKQVKRLLKDRKKKVSVEVSINKSEVIDGIEYIYDFDLLGITILGSRNGVQVREGIEGAQLSVIDLFDETVFKKQKQALAFAYSQLENEKNNKEDVDLANFDEGKTLIVDKSKEAMSDTPWGSVDKTELRKRVVAASNFKEVAKDVFLDLREGWEDGEVTKLKYPVMEIKGENKLVYNRGALGSAKAYAEKNGEDNVLDKLKSIYKHLDLDFDSEEKYDCETFCEDYEEKCNNEAEGQGKDPECGNCECDPQDAGNASEMHSEIAKECGPEEGEPKVYTEEEYNALLSECENLKMKCDVMSQDFENLKSQHDDLCAKHDDLCAKYNDLCAEYEKSKCTIDNYRDIECKYEKAKEDLENIRINGMKSYLDEACEKYGLKHCDIEDISEKCCSGKYSENSEIDRDIAYILFNKNKEKLTTENGRFSVNINKQTSAIIDGSKKKNESSIIERLQSNIKNK
jgi:hypothetical protein